MKICRTCKEEKSLDEFYFDYDYNNHKATCKLCRKIKSKEKQKSFSATDLVCSKCKISKSLDCFSKSQWTNTGYDCYCKPCRILVTEKYSKENYETRRIQQSIYKKSERGKLKSLENRRKVASDSRNRITKSLVSKLAKHGKRRSLEYHSSHYRKFGCSKLELISYIESQFRDGMAWDNYATHWELDHIKPVCSVEWNNLSEVENSNHYTNIRPLLKKENKDKALNEDKKYWEKRYYEAMSIKAFKI